MVGDDIIAAAEDFADAAGAVIRPLFRSALLVEAKGDASPVTKADRDAEAAIRDLIAARFPAHGVIGEEHGSHRADAEWVWVLDPIDGTRAFVTGRPLFGSLIALLHRGAPVLGIIDQPVTGERWVGAAGRPTRFRAPLGGRAACRPCAGVGAAELSCTSPDMFRPADRPGFERLRAAARRVTWGGDCYAYGLLALGLVDIVVDATMKIWDWAALVPVVEGAGGRVTGWRGETLTAAADGRVLAVGDPALLEEAAGLLTDR
ncbi:histidinol-phosphatase [Roseomonas alkaliterrae]|uniref:Histidinol-phosphatase n=1 Tax=Neoroseomonas alkaliterrae TaxID=1452450 RepID=A0A840XXH1_9PROT|nr:histidinol-phosphatase [Neoroseomonas alkaliterrae]MBB5688867.1 myo-inositol-1(or 4)-monophosphatase [Neoroseomonas alkaliterrae]MBR0676741.1 histidinol-phosphatase [Neoroseomonas alkaliterrae]